jgi:hypothetical protein
VASGPVPEPHPELSSPGIFLVMRRMRAPLIVIIVIFAVSVLGLSLMPGQDAQGRPDRMSLFESFYFMSYTATTIGFGELPFAFTAAQRMWVTLSIFLAVIGWAYAIGSLLSLMQDQGFRQALARRSFHRAVRRIREPFLLLVGYGNASKMLARSTTWAAASWSSTASTRACRRSSSTPTAPTHPPCSATPGTPAC